MVFDSAVEFPDQQNILFYGSIESCLYVLCSSSCDLVASSRYSNLVYPGLSSNEYTSCVQIWLFVGDHLHTAVLQHGFCM